MNMNNCDLVNKTTLYMRAAGYRKRTIECYRSILIKFCSKFADPSRLTANDLMQYVVGFSNTNTQRQVVGALKLLYVQVLNQPNKIKKVPYPKKHKTLPEVLTAQEVMRLIDCTNNLKHRAILQLGYACALRVGEVVNIKIKDLHRTGLLTVKNAKGGKDGVVPVPDETMVLLRNYYQAYKPKEWLFEGANGAQYSTSSIQQIMKRARCKAGILNKVTFHTLRHSRATFLVESGLDIYHIQELLRHAKIETTTIYLHTAKQKLRSLIQLADAKQLDQQNLTQLQPLVAQLAS